MHSALVVNSVDSVDPATGRFGLSVPIDVVDSLHVLASPYLAQYGRFTAGVELRKHGQVVINGIMISTIHCLNFGFAAAMCVA